MSRALCAHWILSLIAAALIALALCSGRYEPGSTQVNRAAPTGDLYQFATQIMANLQPRKRIAAYIDSNYDHVQVWGGSVRCLSDHGHGRFALSAPHCPHHWCIPS